jgi:type IV pilus assembly protein PilQ
MKKTVLTLSLFVMAAFIASPLLAVELLDVKPVVVADSVSVEISADIAMTYTYYKVPGQPRAVVDIAEADPEKVEPLIVVNKGLVSSISVDKAQISGIIISRIIFNLVSETDIAVTASQDRKRLTVTFGGSAAGKGKAETSPELPPPPHPVAVAPVAKSEPAPPVTAAPPVTPVVESPPVPDAVADKPVAVPVETAAAAGAALIAASAVVPRVQKLEPVVPVAVAPTRPGALTIKGITTGASSIEIRTNRPVSDYVAKRITGPERLVIDIAGDKINQKARTVAIKKFGIAKARIGISTKNIRIVFDAEKAHFPDYTISTSDDGLLISIK